MVNEKYPPGLCWLSDGSGFFDPDQSGLELVLEAVGVAADIQRNGMVEHPVEDRGGNQAITEDLAPRGEALVAGQDHGPALVAAGDQLKDQVGPLALDGQGTDLVDDQQLGHGVELEFLLQAVVVNKDVA